MTWIIILEWIKLFLKRIKATENGDLHNFSAESNQLNGGRHREVIFRFFQEEISQTTILNIFHHEWEAFNHNKQKINQIKITFIFVYF